MTNSNLAVAACALYLAAGTGCALHVYVAGVPVSDAGESLPAGAALCTGRDPEAPASDADAEIATHLDWLLSQRGFTVTEPAAADYCLLYGHEVDPLMATMRLQFMQGVKGGIESVRRQGPFNYSLSLRLVEASAFRTGSAPDSLWHGGAVISEAPTRSPRNIDLLLVALLEQFPRDTQGTLKKRMHRTDSRVRRLHASAVPEGS
jgi:hypothetical protein